ncbi:ABC transporter permease [Ornithinimicrobium tianjinense]|uniref:Membrane protein n=1 Tax=Ornithinimicrobium tianjinense TaxID=1195761 RepID=A0A917BSC7_9MICO|nr:ABC transporter permease [Ornithinimicrobium tianjinense]GGF55045.1 membrane protein [Ornithinimicrobium tianjinense]
MSERTGVIHDIGYRPYTGPREGRWGIVAGLLRHGALSTFGFGRSARSKVLPFGLLVVTLVPAIVFVGIISFVGMDSELLNYAGYQQVTAAFVSLFVAAQAPVLFTRDLRSGAISLYLARPLGPAAFALVRWASLVLAILAFVVTPLVVMFVGGLGAGAEVRDELPRFLVALAGALLLAVLLATVGATAASLTMRRGLAIGGTIVVLIFGLGATAILQEIGREQGVEDAAAWLGLISPFVLVDAVQHGLGDAASSFETPPDNPTTAALMLLIALAAAAAALLLLVRRYRTRGSR